MKHTRGRSRAGELGGIWRHCLSIQGWIRKAKAHLELNLTKDVKSNKEVFHRNISKRKTKENVNLLLRGNEDLRTEDMEEGKVSSVCIASVLY